uniref:Uncharacterized protein n=1 Tax=Plectus sambesii TaxID=2011161 RepID=A0A914XLW4_9BILA
MATDRRSLRKQIAGLWCVLGGRSALPNLTRKSAPDVTNSSADHYHRRDLPGRQLLRPTRRRFCLFVTPYATPTAAPPQHASHPSTLTPSALLFCLVPTEQLDCSTSCGPINNLTPNTDCSTIVKLRSLRSVAFDKCPHLLPPLN